MGDEMGLGKILQTVTLVWTLLKQSPVAGSVLAKKVLIIAPLSLLKNWEAEFRKWLGSERITIYIVDTGDKVAQFRSYNSAPILVMSHEMLIRTLPEVQKICWDLVVCDENHRMKNIMIKTEWDDGQKQHCHVYRFITTGTVEEKIFQRQVMKRGLDTVGQTIHTQSHFSTEELRDLFTFRDDTECETHDLLQCQCGGSGVRGGGVAG